jgi:hypothetical protein
MSKASRNTRSTRATRSCWQCSRPGVNFDGELTCQRPFDNGAIANWSVNGSSQKVEFLIEGSPNNSLAGGNNIAFMPPVDAVQQFRIQTSACDAQYGRGAGTVNVALKSSGNIMQLNRFCPRSFRYSRRGGSNGCRTEGAGIVRTASFARFWR